MSKRVRGGYLKRPINHRKKTCRESSITAGKFKKKARDRYIRKRERKGYLQSAIVT